jgi:hypothetical protein
MARKPRVPRCSECGVELKLSPERCPLCGADVGGSSPTERLEAEDYQSNVRQLRDQLRRLREEDAEAV